MAKAAKNEFRFPKSYSFPAMWTIQPTLLTQEAQFKLWSRIILLYCQHQRLWRLSLIDALDGPLFHNTQLRVRMSMTEAQKILDWMTTDAGAHRAEWVGKEAEKGTAWVYWRRPEEWAEMLAKWVDETGQKNTVLTLYELVEGEMTVSQDFYGMDPDLLQRALSVLVKRGKAQVFGNDGQQGVKFF